MPSPSLAFLPRQYRRHKIYASCFSCKTVTLLPGTTCECPHCFQPGLCRRCLAKHLELFHSDHGPTTGGPTTRTQLRRLVAHQHAVTILLHRLHHLQALSMPHSPNLDHRDPLILRIKERLRHYGHPLN